MKSIIALCCDDFSSFTIFFVMLGHSAWPENSLGSDLYMTISGLLAEIREKVKYKWKFYGAFFPQKFQGKLTITAGFNTNACDE